MVQTLSENEMKLRMKEIKNERNKLKEEYDEYENYFYQKKLQKENDFQKTCIGKCYKLKSFQTHEIQAFKILNIEDGKAKCIVLINNNNRKSISMVNNLYPFEHFRVQLLSQATCPSFIDAYNEISHEEFIDLYNKYTREIGSNVYAI